MMKIRNLILLGFLAVLFAACSKDDDNQAELDDQIINDYLNQHNLNAEEHGSGLYYIITEEGSGGHPGEASTVEVLYTGYLTNGNVFDETSGNVPVSFPLQNLIEGWKIGIPLMKKGGSATFFIPSDLGYGSTAHYGIPANSVLIFDITLIDYSD
jgi:FKBP-type peptidyl-prolyl cis-trans isomerase FkpA